MFVDVAPAREVELGWNKLRLFSAERVHCSISHGMKKSSKTEKRPRAKDTKPCLKKRPTYAELGGQLADQLNRVKTIDSQAVRLVQELEDCKRCLSEAPRAAESTSEI